MFNAQCFLMPNDWQRPPPANDACDARECAWTRAASVVDAYLRRLGVDNGVVRVAVRADVINRLARRYRDDPATRLEVQAVREVVNLVDRRLASILGQTDTAGPRALARARAGYLLGGGPKRHPDLLLGSGGGRALALGSWSRRYALPQATPEERRCRMPMQRLAVWSPKRLKLGLRPRSGRRALSPALEAKGVR